MHYWIHQQPLDFYNHIELIRHKTDLKVVLKACYEKVINIRIT